MKFLVLPDKFKGSLSSAEACEAMEEGILYALKSSSIIKIPMADGGEGLLDALSWDGTYTKRYITVSDPLFRPVHVDYLISPNKTAIIEMAKATGLLLLKPGERNPALTSSYGTGEIIKDAIQQGAVKITLGIGGSATNDAGIGMAAALGYIFYDAQGDELAPRGDSLVKIAKIDSSKAIDLSNVKIELACDVSNVFHGKNGAAHIFAPQKGADEKMVRELDQGLVHIASLIKKDLGIDIQEMRGAGAAGGLGGGAIAFLGAQMRSGIELVLEHIGAEDHIRNADLIITGEGKLDHQSLNGKVVSGIASVCKSLGKPLIVLCGRNDLKPEEFKAAGITMVYSILEKVSDEQSAFDNASNWIKAITGIAISEFLKANTIN